MYFLGTASCLLLQTTNSMKVTRNEKFINVTSGKDKYSEGFSDFPLELFSVGSLPFKRTGCVEAKMLRRRTKNSYFWPSFSD